MWIYNILIRLYYLGILMASALHPKARKWVSGRKNLRQQFDSINFSTSPWVWFHCSSFGEFQDGRTLMEAFKKQHPEINILLTFFSPTGYDLQKNYPIASAVLYLPLDTLNNAAFILDKVKPKSVFFIRHDVWPNYTRACAARNIPTFLVSFTVNSRSTFFKWPMRAFYRKIFNAYTTIFVQYTDAEKLLRKHRFSENIVVAGNARIDRIVDAYRLNPEQEAVSQFVNQNFCCIAGSTHTKDRQLFMEAFKLLEGQNIKWILVPHEIDTDEIKKAKGELGDRMVLLSEGINSKTKTDLLWIDKVGILASLYRYTDIAFIGGGFSGAGVHSILEPLIYGCAVCCGPNTRDYREAQDLQPLDGVKIINTGAELADWIMKLKAERGLLKNLKSINSNYITQGAGATQKTMDYLKAQPHFPSVPNM